MRMAAHDVEGYDQAARIPIVNPQTNRDIVMQRVSDDIIFGLLKPGTRVSPAAIGKQCGISHIPVREALGELEGRGYLRRIGNRGYFVPELNEDEFDDLYLTRREIESIVNRIAIPRMTDADFDAMAAVQTVMIDARARNEWRLHSFLNRKFHFIPFAASGSVNLLNFLGYLWDMAARYQIPHFEEPGRGSKVAKQHSDLLEAYRNRDLEAVNSIMEAHRSMTADSFKERLAAGLPAGRGRRLSTSRRN